MKNKLNPRTILSPVAVAVILCLFMGASKPDTSGSRQTTRGARFNKISGQPVATMLNINRAAAWYSANGEQERNPFTTNSGLYYPRGTATAVYSAGILWSSKYFNDGITPLLRTNGQSYRNGTKPGRILGIRTGVAEDQNADDVRIWRIRRDWETADLRQDAAELNSVGTTNVSDAQVQAVKDQYKTDWLEWPWQKGAPYYERNGRPGYQPDPNGHFDAEDSTYDEPGLAGADQVVWYVCNDIGASQPWSCPETGMEEQTTIWGYNRTDALGNTIFKRFRIIYKGTAGTSPTATIDSMYLCQWSDVDLGDSGDDLSGCDTTLSLGYTYNGHSVDAAYADFKLPPPASGYDFLQGPRVPSPGDSAVFDLKVIHGYKNLPMTAFMFFAAGLSIFQDPLFNYNGAIGWNQLLRGLPPLPVGPPDPPPVMDNNGNVSVFMFSGDPVARTGWLDGNVAGHTGDPRSIAGPGDRRILLSSGPFTMALGDTQELVSAWVGGLGTDYLGSINVMKFYDKSVQLAYNNLFSLPKAPPAPKVRSTALDGEVILEWDFDLAAVAKTEETVSTGGYRFEGYNIYQLKTNSSDLSATNAKRIVTFDIPGNGVSTILQETFDQVSGTVLKLPVQIGPDNVPLQRFFRITRDEFRSLPLANGQAYYFGVTGYNHLPDSLDPTNSNPLKSLESSPQVVTVIPELRRPGIKYAYSVGDTVQGVTNYTGNNDAKIFPVISNFAAQWGEDLNHNGRLDGNEDANCNGVLDHGEDANGNGVLDHGEDVNGNCKLDPYRYLINFDTSGSLTSMKWTLTNAVTGKILYKNITDLSGRTEYRVSEEGFSLYVGQPPSGLISVTDTSGRNLFGLGSTNASYAILSPDSTLARIAGGGYFGNRKFEVRFDGSGSYALRVLSGIPNAVHVPFSVWDVGKTSADAARKVVGAFKDSANTPARWNLTQITQFGRVFKVWEQMFVTSVSYPTTNDSATISRLTPVNPPSTGRKVLNAVLAKGDSNSAVWGFYIAKLDTGDTLPPPVGTRIRFNKFLEISKGDVKQFIPSLIAVGNVDVAKQDVQQIKVFPNPYYGINRAETDRVNRFVTFSHLPNRATIRIFNLAGNLVRTLEKNDQPGGVQFMRWDLQNQNGLPVASGIYIAYIDMPGVGTTKIVKFAIIQEQQFLRNY